MIVARHEENEMLVPSVLRVSCICAVMLSTLGAGAPVAQNAPPSASSAQPIHLTVHQHDGAEAIDVDGTSLPNSVVFITETAKLSVDLPIVTLNHFTAMADGNGKFQLTISIAADYTPTTQVIVEAQSAGINPTAVAFVVGQPTSEPIVPLFDNFDYP
jgi:hypothetical protein